MNWKSSLKVIGVILALALTVTIPMGYIAAAGPEDGGVNTEMQVVNSVLSEDGTDLVDPILTDAGYVSGAFVDVQTLAPSVIGYLKPYTGGRVGTIGKPVRMYRGIPYAAPPVGNLRWKAPQPVTPWTGIKECTVLPPWPPQQFPTLDRYGAIQESGMSEDCLYVNVVTPAKKTNERLPVLVWFHGGGLTSQSGSRASYNTPPLAQAGVVHVSVTGRICAIGFFAHPALTAEGRTGGSGNQGMLDLVAALKWVKKNIAAFGGDPDRITIYGQSGGGTKISWLMTSPLTRGLFHAAIQMSGLGTGRTLAEAEQFGVNLANKLGITDTGPAGLAALRAKTWQEIIVASFASGSGFTTDITVDGWSLPDTVKNIFKAGKQHDVPHMIEIAATEFVPSNASVQLVPTIRPVGSNLYVAVHNHIPTGWKMDGAIAFHALENGYIMGEAQQIAAGNYEAYAVPAGAKNPDAGWDSLDDWYTEYMMKTWIQFAATGDPNLPEGAIQGPPIPTWPPYTYSEDTYMRLDVPPWLANGFSTPNPDPYISAIP